ncbi:glycosyltransferase family 2 protein [[Clostridium] fimetarium]|uniref:Glycosyl transferase family 2 n=1 Tax=[Clostridium] fimetarium TaxID=99656 RepID=A0A1I0P536_9FIRM|nr:glycosyltransferase family 2 protein [[Clostridium] fimetarium]SEW09179.1 Glycosyl transferase family 2 [[Clostridium] fimetarium]
MNQIFCENSKIIVDMLNRILNCMQLKKLYIYSEVKENLDGLYDEVEKIYLADVQYKVYEGLIYINIESTESLIKIIPWLKKNKYQVEILLYISDNDNKDKNDKILEQAYNLEKISPLNGQIYLFGKIFEYPGKLEVAVDFKVLAIIHTYNEADIISKTMTYILEQGLDIYLVDNWSDDGTFEIAQNIYDRFPQRVYLERFPEDGQTQYYEWYHQLKRTEDISKNMPYDWFIHYDADEMRISPWRNVTLLQAIYWIDTLGYNLIENTVIDFKLTENNNDENIFMKDVYFDFGHKETHFMQTKSWKKTEYINIKDSGGHIAKVPNPKLYPLKILNRHYPFRSLKHAQKKVFMDRRPRFEKERKERGWHGHYDFVQKNQDLIIESDKLIKWNENTFYDYYIPLFLGCGIIVLENNKVYDRQFPTLNEKNIVIYGAGNLGRVAYKNYSKYCNIVGWVDQNYKFIPNIYCETILSADKILDMDYDYIFIAVENDVIRKEIQDELNRRKINNKKIL